MRFHQVARVAGNYENRLEKRKPADCALVHFKSFLVPLSGFRGRPCSTPSDASTFFIGWLYAHIPLPDAPISNETPRKIERNAAIRVQFASGMSVPDLAKLHGISEQRVHQILHNRRR